MFAWTVLGINFMKIPQSVFKDMFGSLYVNCSFNPDHQQSPQDGYYISTTISASRQASPAKVRPSQWATNRHSVQSQQHLWGRQPISADEANKDSSKNSSILATNL
jgi:hypothetical protein